MNTGCKNQAYAQPEPPGRKSWARQDLTLEEVRRPWRGRSSGWRVGDVPVFRFPALLGLQGEVWW